LLKKNVKNPPLQRKRGSRAGGPPGLEKLRVCKTQGLIFASQAEQCNPDMQHHTEPVPALLPSLRVPRQFPSAVPRKFFMSFLIKFLQMRFSKKGSDLFWPKCCAAFANQINQCNVLRKI
jgi:hypothetical protein